MATKILKCECDHKYQDRVYGKKQRVHNYGEKDKNWRCTVCAKIRS